MELKPSRVLVLLCFTAAISLVQCASISDEIQEEWNAFKSEYNKNYDSEQEEKLRMGIFIENRNKIAEHNKLFEKGEKSFELGVNQFSDMAHEEVVRIMNGYKQRSYQDVRNNEESFHEYSAVRLPKTVDWRKKGYVTPVKNQGFCGSCWAFSSTGALEGQHFRKYKKLVSLSEQNLIDCAGKYGTYGCHGGWMDEAFNYVMHNHGIDTEDGYPYEGQDAHCRFNPKKVGTTVKGFKDVPHGDEKALQHAVATVGPIAVAIDADSYEFLSYKSGLFYVAGCSTTLLDHAVLVVGYGTEKGKDYWLVKNSWSDTWGDKGYIKMSRNRNNNCGIATNASYPLV